MIDNIKNLFQQIENRTDCIATISGATGIKGNTIARHWLTDSGFWSIPEKHQETVVTILQKIIKKQNDDQNKQD